MPDADPPERESEVWPVQNHLLARIEPKHRAKLAKSLERVELKPADILYDIGAPLTHVYFPISGMIAFLAVMNDGRAAETATIGCEGATGLSASGYEDTSFSYHVVQLPGTAYRVRRLDFEDMVDASVGFCSAVGRWREVLLRMTLQSVACNALHNVRQRCARWILATHDRSEGQRLPLTQEFLAEMLGVKRNAINIVARDLQQQGLIEYVRGRVTILDAPRLQRVACECYGLVAGEIAKLSTGAPSAECDD